MLTINQLQQHIHTILATYNGISDRVINIAPTQAHISGDDGEIVTEWISPIAVKQIQSVTIATPLTLPSAINVGDHIRLNLSYLNGSWMASEIVAAPIAPLSIANILDTYDQVSIAFTYIGAHSTPGRDAILIESYQEANQDDMPWVDPAPRDSYLNIIADDGVTLVYESHQSNLAVNQCYTGVLYDYDGELTLTEIRTIGNRAPDEAVPRDLTKSESDLVVSLLAYKRIADITGVDVQTVAIAANTQALKNLEADGLTIFPDHSAC